MRFLILSLVAVACAAEPTVSDDAAPPPPDGPTPGNRAPVAVVADQMVLVGDVVTLSGEASSDPDGDPLQYTWSIRSRPPLSRVELDSTSGTVVRFTADRAGIVVVDLVVSDGEVDSPRATALIAVLTSHDAPMAYAGPDQTVRVESEVVLSGIQSRDPHGLPLLYDWALVDRPAGSQAQLAGDTTVAPRFSPDLAGAYELELVVHNGSLESAPDRVTVTAVPAEAVITGDVPNGVLNSGEVYIFGTVSEGSCGRDAIAHWSAPNVAAVGFGCYANESTAQIRNDGTLIYTNTFEDLLREFHCDGCPGWTPAMPYPGNVLANDTILATPPCVMGVIQGFIVGVTGARLHRCGNTWYDANGVAVPIAGAPLSYGHANKVLTATAIIDVATGQQVPITGLGGGTTLTTRVAGPTSFWMVRDTGGVVTRWRIDHGGAATLEGTYPPPPAGYTPSGSARLDSSGRLFQQGRGPATFEDVVIARSLNGLSEVPYTEATNPVVKLHISSLVTGP